MKLINPIIPSLRLYLHDYIPAKTRKRNPAKEYLSLLTRAEKIGCFDLVDLCKEMVVAIAEQRNLLKEDFELYHEENVTQKNILVHIKNYYIWQNYSYVKDLPSGLICQQNKTCNMINVTPALSSENMAFITVFEFRYD